MSNHSLHKQIARLLDSDMMVWVLDDSLDQKGAVRLCNTCSLSYDGTRTKSLPKRKLVMDLVDEFYENDESAKLIVKYLYRANSDLLRHMQELSVEEIRKLTEDQHRLFAEDRIGNMIFALASDSRLEVQQLVSRLGERLLSMEDDLGKVAESLFWTEEEEEEGWEEGRIEDVPPTPLYKEIRELKATLEHVEKERDERQTQLDDLINERKSLKSQISQLTREVSTLQKAHRAFEEEKASLEKRLQEMSEKRRKGEQPSLLHQLVRDSRRIQHDLDKLCGHFGSDRNADKGPGPFMEALGNTMGEVKDLVAHLCAQQEDERNAIRKMMQDIGSEVHTLRVEVKRLQEVGVKPMRIQSAVPRVGVFVDVQNVFYAARQFNARVDFEKLLHATVGNRRLIRAVAYVVQSPEVDQTGFLNMLQQKSYEVKRKDLRLRSDGSAKGDWDMGIAIDIISLADRLDVVVLVSGDGDFVALVNLVKTMGPRMEVFSFPHNTARDLMQVADSYYPIEEGLLMRMEEVAPPSNEGALSNGGEGRTSCV